MKAKERYTLCKATKKYSYSSESKAMRAVCRYEDIERAYYCDYCNGYHTTSQTLEETLKYGGIDEEVVKESTPHEGEITLDMVAEKLRILKERL